jgi:hypothetical protein
MDKNAEIDRLILRTVEQGHSPNCARQAIFPAPGEERIAPKCICSGLTDQMNRGHDKNLARYSDPE